MNDTINIIYSIIIVLIFTMFALMMHLRVLSALLALPILAITIALICNVSPAEIMNQIINNGSTKLANTYTTTLFGAILAELIQKLDIASKFVKFSAEFASNNTIVTTLTLIFVTSVLFSTIGGLGAVIMVGTIILPILLSLSISPKTAGAIYLFAISLGGTFNLAGWQLYIDVLKLTPLDIIKFVVPFSLLFIAIMFVFLLIEIKEDFKTNFKYLLGLMILIIAGFTKFNSYLSIAKANIHSNNDSSYKLFFYIFGASILYAIWRHNKNYKQFSNFILLVPLIPLILVLAFNWNFIPAFVASIALTCTLTWTSKSPQILTASIIEGITKVIPAVFLMIGIGMLLNCVSCTNVSSKINPVLQLIIPTNALSYIVTFTILAPMALYRGPLNIWGMGGAIISLLKQSGKLSGNALMAMLMSVGQIQGICDPTNTQNIWIANYLGLETQELLTKTLPYVWVLVILGLTLAVFQGYLSWN